LFFVRIIIKQWPNGWQVDQAESIAAAVVREVAEETGVTAEFVSVVGFREYHGENK
jgi:8-oxo-dGTP pyrophosphatase MutT (NUDIX family)